MLRKKSSVSQLSTLWRREWGVLACSLIGMDDTDHHLLGEDDKNQTVILLTPFTLSIYLGLWRYESGLPIADILSSQQWFSVSEFLNFFHTWDHHTVMTKLNFGKKKEGGQFRLTGGSTMYPCWEYQTEVKICHFLGVIGCVEKFHFLIFKLYFLI